MKSSIAMLCLLHLIGDAVILWLGYAWLGLPESDGLHLAWSLAVILLVACSALWLHGTSFAYFSGPSDSNLANAAKSALRHLPALAVLALLALVLYVLVTFLDGALAKRAFPVASWLTMTIRKPIPPVTIAKVFHGFVVILRWFVLPAFLATAAVDVSRRGFGGFAQLIRKPRLVRSIVACLLLIAAVWVPTALLSWIPDMPNFSAEMGSFLLRGSVAYLLFATLLLAMERTAAGGIPSLVQRNNSGNP